MVKGKRISVKKIDKILDILSDSITYKEEKEIIDGIICSDGFNSVSHAYFVYTNKLEKLKRRNVKVKKLMSELNDEEKERLYDKIWRMAHGHVIFIVENYDDICDDEEEEEELWMI